SAIEAEVATLAGGHVRLRVSDRGPGIPRNERERVFEAFYRRVRPGGPGWTRISERLGYGREPIPGGALAWTNWIAGVVAVYATLFGIGKVVLGDLLLGGVLLAVAAAAF
ncbi:ATP-binding protein, partial [Acinetobacter baumannii]|uniref:ATP-binding protein n=1 Tax=Acinetobacter baumannii TaxID=470 RepID=UPI003399939C